MSTIATPRTVQLRLARQLPAGTAHATRTVASTGASRLAVCLGSFSRQARKLDPYGRVLPILPSLSSIHRPFVNLFLRALTVSMYLALAVAGVLGMASAEAAPINVTFSDYKIETTGRPYTGAGLSDTHVLGFTPSSVFFYDKDTLTEEFGYSNIGTVIDGGSGRNRNEERMELGSDGIIRNVRNSDNATLNGFSTPGYNPIAISGAFSLDGTDYFAFINNSDLGVYVSNFSGGVTATPLKLSDHSEHGFHQGVTGLDAYFDSSKQGLEALRFGVTANEWEEPEGARFGDFSQSGSLDVIGRFGSPGGLGMFQDVAIDAPNNRIYITTDEGNIAAISYQVIPEPGTTALMLFGLGAAYVARAGRRSRVSKA